MRYTISVDSEAQATIDVLPPAELEVLADVFSLLVHDPWSAPSINPDANPDGAVRTIGLAGGQAMVTYLVVEDERRVDVLQIAWVG